VSDDVLLKQAQYALKNWNLTSGHATLLEALHDEIKRLRAELSEARQRIKELEDDLDASEWDRRDDD
jgi:predicted  nucleic acid-binding Zn-ribbon protein